jgi:AcrR family transcriptional regulator
VLIEQMAELIATVGLEEATVRSVAERAGVKPSTVIYHFASKDQLVAAAFEHALDADFAWRNAALVTARKRALDATMFADFLHGIVHADGNEHRSILMVRWACFVGSELTRTHTEISRRWASMQERFWDDALAVFGIDRAVARSPVAIESLYAGP